VTVVQPSASVSSRWCSTRATGTPMITKPVVRDGVGPRRRIVVRRCVPVGRGCRALCWARVDRRRLGGGARRRAWTRSHRSTAARRNWKTPGLTSWDDPPGRSRRVANLDRERVAKIHPLRDNGSRTRDRRTGRALDYPYRCKKVKGRPRVRPPLPFAVVVTAGENLHLVVGLYNAVHQPMFFIDAPRCPPGKIAFQ